MSILLYFILIIIGFILLIKGAEFLVDGSSNIARKFHIPQIVIGLTIVSIGTSLPEMFISVTSSINGYTDMAIGNVIGSNICNLLLILGLSATIRPLKFKRETRLIEIPICLILTILFAILCNTTNKISRIEASLLLVFFVMFIIYTIIMAIKGEKFDKEDGEETENTNNNKQISILKSIIYIVLGIIGLKLGGDLVVENSTIIANYFNLSEKIISLTIISIGTSLPELVTTVVAAIKGNSDISIGNIIGSNIFNMTLITGTTSLIKPIFYNWTYNFEMLILILANTILALFLVIPPKNKMTRKNSFIYLILYIVYTVILFNT